MHPESMKHKASLWDGEYGVSGHITDVHWEGDISPDELREVADQISEDWHTLDLELDPQHPRHGQVFRLYKHGDDLSAIATEVQKLHAERELSGQYVWVHCCQHVYDAAGELQDETGRAYRQVFNTVMFCTEFSSFDAIAAQCDENFGRDAWSEYELYLDDDLPPPVAAYG